mmetsp:Transcript_84530/g.171403  ORF Transcript_84530/g.171403 Transcript_84530/m.171403 type:complete len:209 (-) Transcript_84530:49-675(-)
MRVCVYACACIDSMRSPMRASESLCLLLHLVNAFFVPIVHLDAGQLSPFHPLTVNSEARVDISEAVDFSGYGAFSGAATITAATATAATLVGTCVFFSSVVLVVLHCKDDHGLVLTTSWSPKRPVVAVITDSRDLIGVAVYSRCERRRYPGHVFWSFGFVFLSFLQTISCLRGIISGITGFVAAAYEVLVDLHFFVVLLLSMFYFFYF